MDPLSRFWPDESATSPPSIPFDPSQRSNTMITLSVNGKSRNLDIPGDMPLLWTLRDVLNMTGTKFGCGLGLCGACTIHIDGQPTRSCITPASAAAGKKITTIEAIGATPAGKKIQAAWLALDVPQCGYCQSGQIMSASALLVAKPKPSDADIDQAMQGNICRCGTYSRIRAAVKQASVVVAVGAADPTTATEA
jgi:isoquinoline 1-oxidoreductase subunit alpha